MKAEIQKRRDRAYMRRLVLVWFARRLHDWCDYLHWVPGYRCQLCEWSWMIDARFSLGIYGPISDENRTRITR